MPGVMAPWDVQVVRHERHLFSTDRLWFARNNQSFQR